MENTASCFDAFLATRLGPLERKVLNVVWRLRTATVREVRCNGKLWQTYTAIMTTMDRLHKKGLLNRIAEGRAFRYSVKFSPEEVECFEALKRVRKLLGSPYAALHLCRIVETIGTYDERLLDQLQSLIVEALAKAKSNSSCEDIPHRFASSR